MGRVYRDRPADEGYGQEQTSDAPRNARQGEREVVILEYVDSMDGDGVRNERDDSAIANPRKPNWRGRSTALASVQSRASNRDPAQGPTDWAGSFGFPADANRADAYAGPPEAGDQHEEDEVHRLMETQVQQRSKDDVARSGEDERDEKRIRPDDSEAGPDGGGPDHWPQESDDVRENRDGRLR